MESLKFKNVKYKNVLNDLSFKVEKNDFLTVIGLNGSGKSTIVKILMGLLEFQGMILIDDIALNDNTLNVTDRKISFAVNDLDELILAETVFDELAFPLENLGKVPAHINKLVHEVAERLQIENLLYKKPLELNFEEKKIVSFAASIISKPDILVLDNIIEGLSYNNRKKIIDILLEYKDKITIVNFTTNSEESLLGNKVAILDKGKIVCLKKLNDFYKETDEISKYIELPFSVDLSNRLKFYDLTDKLYFDLEKLVNDLWK